MSFGFNHLFKKKKKEARRSCCAEFVFFFLLDLFTILCGEQTPETHHVRRDVGFTESFLRAGGRALGLLHGRRAPVWHWSSTAFLMMASLRMARLLPEMGRENKRELDSIHSSVVLASHLRSCLKICAGKEEIRRRTLPHMRAGSISLEQRDHGILVRQLDEAKDGGDPKRHPHGAGHVGHFLCRMRSPRSI
jgi:hypothetical protein